MQYRVYVNGRQFDVVVEPLAGVSPALAHPAAQPAYTPVPHVPAPAYAAPAYVAPASTPAPSYTAPAPTPVPVSPPPSEPASASSGAEERVLSPMPGNIWQIPVEVGQTVAVGQCLIILEAMKMENEIVAPRAGVVKQILVTKGAAVNTDDVLVVIA